MRILARQVEVGEALLDLIVALFEPLTPGNGGGSVVEKKEKLASAIRESLRGGSRTAQTRASQQTYTSLGHRTYQYESSRFKTEIKLDQHGIVENYPPYWKMGA